MERIIISGFDKFGKHSSNPSENIINHIKSHYNESSVRTLVLPTSYERSWAILKQTIDEFKPNKILMFGLSEKAEDFVFEKVAINYCSASIADNDGVLVEGSKILDEGDDGIFTTLPVEDYILNCGGRISLSAGSYVCNCLFYQCLHYMKKSHCEVGFIHVPLNEKSQFDLNEFAEKVINFAISRGCVA